MIKDFIFFKVLIPLFRNQIKKILDTYRLCQVYAIEINPSGEEFVVVTKEYPNGANLQLYAPEKALYDPETLQYLGCFEEIYATARVIRSEYGCSRAIITHKKKELKHGLLVKNPYSKREHII